MSKWKFTLPNGVALRQAIMDEDCNTVYQELIKGYEWIEQRVDDDYTIDALIEEVKWDLDCQAFDEDSVNAHLNTFYDYCNEMGVWIPLC